MKYYKICEVLKFALKPPSFFPAKRKGRTGYGDTKSNPTTHLKRCTTRVIKIAIVRVCELQTTYLLTYLLNYLLT